MLVNRRIYTKESVCNLLLLKLLTKIYVILLINDTLIHLFLKEYMKTHSIGKVRLAVGSRIHRPSHDWRHRYGSR